MNKFLEFTFKMGKIMSSILLVIVLLIILCTGIGLLNSNNENLKIPKFEEISVAIKNVNNAKQSQTQINNVTNNNSSMDKYNNKIKRIIKDNDLRTDMENTIKKYVADVDEDLRTQYLNGLARFYKEGLRELNSSDTVMNIYLLAHVKRIEGYYYNYEYEQAKKNIKQNGTYNKYICLGLLYDYDSMFEDAVRNREAKLQEKAMNKIAQEIVLGVALIVFTILLFLPVLIKIEENTRPVNIENSNENKNEDTKTCEHCGKLIKKNAKKCRYCGEWLNNAGGNE